MAPQPVGSLFNSNIKLSSALKTNEKKINEKWITGNRRGIDELVKKYNSSPTNHNQSCDNWKKTKTKPPIKEEPPALVELVDERFISSYTSDYSAMMTEIEKICRKHPTLAER